MFIHIFKSSVIVRQTIVSYQTGHICLYIEMTEQNGIIVVAFFLQLFHGKYDFCRASF